MCLLPFSARVHRSVGTRPLSWFQSPSPSCRSQSAVEALASEPGVQLQFTEQFEADGGEASSQGVVWGCVQAALFQTGQVPMTYRPTSLPATPSGNRSGSQRVQALAVPGVLEQGG